MATAAIVAAGIARQLIIYKNVPISEIGEYLFIATLVVFLQPVITGNIKIYLISRAPELPPPAGLGLLKTVLFFEAGMGVVGAALLFLLLKTGLPIARWVNTLSDVRLLYWVFLIVAASGVFSHLQRFLSYTLHISTSNVVEVASAALYVAMLAFSFFVLQARGVAAILACWVISTAIPFFVMMGILARRFWAADPASKEHLVAGLRYSVPALSSEYGQTIVGYFDRLAVGHYMTAASLGIYGFIYNILNMAQVASRSVLDSLFGSYFLYAMKRGREDTARTIMDVYVRWSVLAGLSVLAFFAFYGRHFILLVGKPEMMPAFPYFFLLWPVFILNILIPVLSVYLNYISEDRMKLVRANAIVIPASIVIYIVAISQFRLVGACVASVATAVASYVAMAWQTREWHMSPLSFVFTWPCAGTFLAAFAAGKIFSLGLLRLPGDFLPVLCGGLVTVATCLAAAYLVKYVSYDDKAKLKAVNDMRMQTEGA